MPTNRRTAEDDGIDFYPTPKWCVRALLDKEQFAIDDPVKQVWEPAVGDGAIADVLYENGYTVLASDLHDHGYGDQFVSYDFLSASPEDLQDRNCVDIITNPPYNIANDFIQKALELEPNKIAFLMRLAFLEGQERYDELFSKNPPARVWVFSERITMYKKYAEDKKGSGTTAYAWFVWQKDHTGPTEVKWLRGYKNV